MTTNKPILLSTLWIFVILNMLTRDIHELGRPGMLEQMMSGVIEGVKITEGLMLLGGIMMEVMLIMVVLSQILKQRVNRLANIFVGFLSIILILMNNLSPDLDNIFFMVIEIVALLAIINISWQWKVNNDIASS